MGSWDKVKGFVKVRIFRRSKRVKTDMKWSKYSADLSSYTSACQQDPKLKSFDDSLMQRTNAVIKSVAARAEPKTDQSIPLDSLMDAYGFVLQVNQDALRVIIESKEDVWRNKNLKSLVELYFKSSASSLYFCNTVKNCVTKTGNSQLLVRLAMTKFEKDSSLDSGGGRSLKEKHAETLDELKKVKATGDPFDEQFLEQYKLVYDEQVRLLEGLRKQIASLDKKERKVETWRRVSKVVFITALVSALVLSVVAALVSFPPVVGAIASVLPGVIDSGGKWCSELWKRHEAVLKRQGGLVYSIEKETTVMNHWMETIRILVERLKIPISAMLNTIDLAVEREDEEEMRLVMQDLKKHVDELTEKMKLVGQCADEYSKSVLNARVVVLRHIATLPAVT